MRIQITGGHDGELVIFVNGDGRDIDEISADELCRILESSMVIDADYTDPGIDLIVVPTK